MTKVVLLPVLLFCAFAATQAWDLRSVSIKSDNGYDNEQILLDLLNSDQPRGKVENPAEGSEEDFIICTSCKTISKFLRSSVIKIGLNLIQTMGCKMLPVFRDECKLFVSIAITMAKSPGAKHFCTDFNLCHMLKLGSRYD